MKTNNKYYKLIAQLLDESIDNTHHTDLYYTKRIAESYGETYTNLGNVNKHLRDFAEDVGVELDNKHHTNRWYLKKIAEIVYDGELEHNTENYYLKIISENIQPTPTQSGVSFKFIFNGEPVTNKKIYDYGNYDEYTLDENGEANNLPFPHERYDSRRYTIGSVIEPLGIDYSLRKNFGYVYYEEPNKIKWDSREEFSTFEGDSVRLIYDMTKSSIDVTME